MECCENFDKATRSFTDNERWGPAINSSYFLKGTYEIGAIEDPIKFCPWCGHLKDRLNERMPTNLG